MSTEKISQNTIELMKSFNDMQQTFLINRATEIRRLRAALEEIATFNTVHADSYSQSFAIVVKKAKDALDEESLGTSLPAFRYREEIERENLLLHSENDHLMFIIESFQSEGEKNEQN